MLILDIAFHSLRINHANSTSKITPRPQTATPKTLTFQLRKRRKHSNSRSRLKHTNDIRQRIRRRQLNKQMHMIRHHFDTNHTPIVRLTNLHQENDVQNSRLVQQAQDDGTSCTKPNDNPNKIHNATKNASPASAETPCYEMNPNQSHYQKPLASKTPYAYNREVNQ